MQAQVIGVIVLDLSVVDFLHFVDFVDYVIVRVVAARL